MKESDPQRHGRCLTAAELIQQLQQVAPETLVLAWAEGKRWEIKELSETFTLDDADADASAVSLIAGEWR